MIRIGNKEVRIEKFPDGTPRIKVTPETHAAALTTMKMCQINVIGE